MFFFLFSLALSYEISDLVSCLDLVKWKIDNYESSFDLIMSQTSQNPEKVLEKIIASMLETCIESINSTVISQIASQEPLDSLNCLVEFPNITESLNLTISQEKILSLLEEYSKSKNDSCPIYYFLVVPIVLLFLLFKYSHLFRPQKVFKND